ncbi:26S proteasome regulatory subunit 6A [Perkinsus olseni]|uniref:26S proteasome regulatory subunit 6A n=1 Tax=Perkinsus olseni TaxID=32597 RepID=A0A7J6PJD9_PEROL|nr:26S proteasome regulatory subunit 6A [Perkinsus olseni]
MSSPSSPPPEQQPLLSSEGNTNNAANPQSAAAADQDEDAEMKSLMEDLNNMSTEGIQQRSRLTQNDIRVYKSEVQRLTHELNSIKEKMKDNQEKINLNRQLPHLVGSVAEILPADEDEADLPEAAPSNGRRRKEKKSMVVKTTTRQTIYLPIIGLVPVDELKPNDLVGLNKDSYLVLDKLPQDFDSRVKAMEVDERPTDQYYGPAYNQYHNHDCCSNEGKTMMARACAAATNATFLKLAGPQLVQMFIGDGAKMVRDAFNLAKEKAPAIIFIDELDAIGMKRSAGGELSGVREVQRTMLELLNQLDGFSSDDRVKVIAATNRADMLDPALLRSGRLDRKVELPLPNEDARKRILQIHSRKMNVNKDDVNFDELARCTDDFNGAQLKAVCVEAGMEALRRGATELQHEDFMQGIAAVQAKKKTNLNYYA